jgi:Holliday junction resolvase RusA-like endonuclease
MTINIKINGIYNMIEFRVDGEPKPKQSFKVVSREGKESGNEQNFNHSPNDNRKRRQIFGYTPKKVKVWQRTVAWYARAAAKGEILIGDIGVELFFEVSTKRRIDVDNLSKAVLDAIKGILFEDDSSIIDLHVTKKISKTPGVLIRVREIDNGARIKRTVKYDVKNVSFLGANMS